ALLARRGGECGHCFQGVVAALRRTRRWAAQVGLDPKRVVEGVRKVGGFCDCWVVREGTPERFGWSSETMERPSGPDDGLMHAFVENAERQAAPDPRPGPAEGG